MHWFNALCDAKASCPLTPKPRQRSSLFSPALQNPLLASPTNHFPQKLTIDDKLDELWKQQAAMDDILSTLLVLAKASKSS